MIGAVIGRRNIDLGKMPKPVFLCLGFPPLPHRHLISQLNKRSSHGSVVVR